MNYHKNKKAGFTLVELLIAIAILAIALPSFFVFLNGQIFNTKLSLDMSNAIFLGERKIEELMSKRFDDSDLTNSNTSNDSSLDVDIDKSSLLSNYSSYTSTTFDHVDNTVILNNTTFYIFWNVIDDTTGIINFKEIGVIVYWIWQGKGHKIFLTTIKREE